jgi:hypothetical protein
VSDGLAETVTDEITLPPTTTLILAVGEVAQTPEFPYTEMLPEVVPNVTVIEFVPEPAVMLAPAGKFQM